MTARPGVAAIVLAGGRSRRFGRDKLAEVVDGQPLLAHAVASVRAVADEVIVVAGVGEPPVGLEGVRVVHDRAPFQGPLAALAVGLRASESPLAIVIGGDMPSLQAAIAAALVDRLARATVDAAVLEQAGGLRPLPLAVRREPAVAAAERLLEGDERSLRALVTALGATAVPAAEWQALDPGGRSVRDIDTPADLG